MSRQFLLKKALPVLLAALLVCLLALVLRVRLEQRRLAACMIRLHVVAASDAPADQERKLQVRDALLPVLQTLTAGCASADEAEIRLRQGLPELRAAAEAALKAGGEELRLSLSRERFPRRDYPTFSLPAGAYRALRVTIGPGKGHNWWCVAFPALCLAGDGDEFSDAARAAGFSDDQVELMQADTPVVRFKFRLLDWLEAWFG